MGVITRSAQILRFPVMKNHIEEFIAHDLPDILGDLRYFGIISGFCYVPRISKDYNRGIDFYIIIGKKEIPIQISDNEEVINAFMARNIEVIFLPQKKRGRLMFSEEQKKVAIDTLTAILERHSRS